MYAHLHMFGIQLLMCQHSLQKTLISFNEFRFYKGVESIEYLALS